MFREQIRNDQNEESLRLPMSRSKEAIKASIAKAIARFSREVTDMSRNFPIAEAEAMRSGEPRDGAGELEICIRRKYRAIKKLGDTLRTLSRS